MVLETTRRPLGSVVISVLMRWPLRLRGCARSDEALDGCQVVGQHGDALGVGHQGGEALRQARTLAGDGFDGVGELRRMRGGERDLGRAAVAASRLGERNRPASGVRIEQVAAVPA